MSIVLQSTGGGSVSIVEPTTASNFTQTLPASTGTVMVSGNMPAFSAYLTSAQSFTNSTFSQMNGWTENFDTASAFNTSSNGRFIPQVAGYYQINGQVAFGGATSGYAQMAIYKNGGQFSTGNTMINNNQVGAMCSVSDVVYLNGSTDYVELWAWQNSGGSLSTQATSNVNKFSGVLVRAA